MNAAVKALNHGGIDLSLDGWGIWHSTLVILLLTIIVSSFGIIYCRDNNRQLYSQLQVLTTTSDNLHIEWGRLLLEESTWATQSRIQQKAHNELHMTQPAERILIKVSE
ncbi:MAG: cell division protein FtsL [Gammaproteobacteria bacterium]